MTRLVTGGNILRQEFIGWVILVQEQKDPEQRLRELERTRQKAIEQINSSYGTVRAELQKVIAQLDAEIAAIRRKVPEG